MAPAASAEEEEIKTQCTYGKTDKDIGCLVEIMIVIKLHLNFHFIHTHIVNTHLCLWPQCSSRAPL